MKLSSYTITQGRDRAPARSYLKGIGFTDEDLRKPIIGIANTWIETMPCNYNLRYLADFVKKGVREAGGTPMEFNTIAISDGITMGTEGMKASLVSRDFIADSMVESHDQNTSVRRKARSLGGIALPLLTKTLVDRRHDLPRFDVPSAQDVRLPGRGQVLPVLTEADGNQPGNIVRQFDSTASRREAGQVKRPRGSSFAPRQEPARGVASPSSCGRSDRGFRSGRRTHSPTQTASSASGFDRA